MMDFVESAFQFSAHDIPVQTIALNDGDVLVVRMLGKVSEETRARLVREFREVMERPTQKVLILPNLRELGVIKLGEKPDWVAEEEPATRHTFIPEVPTPPRPMPIFDEAFLSPEESKVYDSFADSVKEAADRGLVPEYVRKMEEAAKLRMGFWKPVETIDHRGLIKEGEV